MILSRAPLTTGNKYDPMQSDIWALGISIYWVATKTYPFKLSDQMNFFENLKNDKFNFEKVSDLELRNVIKACLTVDPNKRPTTEDIINMPYCQNSKNTFGLKSKIPKSQIASSCAIIKPIKSKKYLSRLNFPKILV
ncbi:hypothetical protein TVAG_281010 [Trichomonas vaginalis G3]|uniref:Protein kinase domain-containing protein n=1 Tax=Trichomonas vaginalis (strain ATCC PRA-98 / G3) TaxID=412133 RepID=A2DRM1_TRIV3|nr:hypothetical protein TVAG_281010 [Trichomonas vaginalis G3]|eukprot:XP_001329207.1 hypothetical protein [Trichomonas vaginalis G3]